MNRASDERGGRAIRLLRLSIAIVVVLPLLRAGSLGAQTEASWLFADVSFPAQVDTFIVVRTERWPDPARGAVLHYQTAMASGATFDVHIQALPAGLDEQEGVRADVRRTVNELARYQGTGHGPTSVVIDTVRAMAVEAGDRVYEGHMAEATLRTAGRTGHTLAYVFAKPPSLVKFRITYEPSQEAVLESRIPRFIGGILERLESFQERPGPGVP